MKQFSYRAIHKSGEIHKGTLHAENENELISVLARQKLELIDAKEKKYLRLKRRTNLEKNEKNKIAFAEQMEDLLNAGLPFPKSLELVLQNMEKSEAKDKLTNIENKIRSGASITSSLATQTAWFDPIALAIIKSAEKSGAMDKAFTQLSTHFTKQKEFRSALIRAIRYPLFLLTLALLVASFMMIWVVPQIMDFLLNQGNELPLATRLLIHTTEILNALWWVFPIFIIFATSAILLARRLSQDALQLTDNWILRTPFLGIIWRKLALARMMDSLALLIHSGLNLPAAFKISIGSLNNYDLAAKAKTAHGELLQGTSFSKSLHALLPSFLVQRIQIAEASNQLPRTIEAIAKNLNKEARGSLTTFLSGLEPSLTLLVGGIMIWVVLAVLGPLYASLGPLSGGM